LFWDAVILSQVITLISKKNGEIIESQPEASNDEVVKEIKTKHRKLKKKKPKPKNISTNEIPETIYEGAEELESSPMKKFVSIGKSTLSNHSQEFTFNPSYQYPQYYQGTFC